MANALDDLNVDANGCVVCPDCGTSVNLAGAGRYNLDAHQKGAKCRNLQQKQTNIGKQKETQKAFTAYFSQPASGSKRVSSSVVPHPRIQSTRIQSTSTSDNTLTKGPINIPPSSSSTSSQASPNVPDASCLVDLLKQIKSLPSSVPEAGPSHPFAQFSGNLEGMVPDGEDAWETWDPPLNMILQCSPAELRQLVARGPLGLVAFHRFLAYLAREHHVSAALFENKVHCIISAIQEMAPQPDTPHQTSVDSALGPNSESQQDSQDGLSSTLVIESQVANGDLDEIEILDAKLVASSFRNHHTRTPQCVGVVIQLPSDLSPHTAYPFALHESIGDPWDYTVQKGVLTLRARDCCHAPRLRNSQCFACASLLKNASLIGILDRMEKGVNESCPFHYHGSGGMVKILKEKAHQIRALRLNRLNDAWKVTTKAAALDLHKDWVMAVGSGKIQRVDRLVQTALKNRRGIRGMLDLYQHATQDIYHTRSYSDDDKLKAIFLWRMGGQRLAGMAHRTLGLPSVKTSQRNSAIPRLRVSPSKPTVDEVEANTTACTMPIKDIIDFDTSILHQTIMVDELKVEERPRWDDQTDFILGACREHAPPLAGLQYSSKDEVDLLFKKMCDEEVHLANNATVAALGILHHNHRLYGALPVLISGQCGHETGPQHAAVLETVLEGAKSSKIRTVCISSDGESRRGQALVQLTMKSLLSPSSPIYKHLAHLPFMNLEVGDDDITADKDFKHVFKRCRNLCLRARGIRLHGVELLPSVFRTHFLDNGATLRHTTSLLKPDDKQDVKLAYDFLSEAWRLPSLDDPSRPGFSDARCSLQTLGELFRHLLLPYVCIDLSLSEQLVHLSAAAHMLLAMACEDRPGSLSLLMPSQLYLDIMIMIKNVYFCVAKAKVNGDDAVKFYLILLGTDRLEEDFGGVRTVVGNDSGVDLLQLSLRLAGITEIASILAQHPEWDQSPRRLKLPALSKDGLEVHKGVDHIKPASWRGDVSVKGVNLTTCWDTGRREVRKLKVLDNILIALEEGSNPNVNIFQPFGTDIIRARRTTEDKDDTAEDKDNTAEDYSDSTTLPNSTPRGLDISVEEAAVEEDASPQKHQPFFQVEEQKVWKGRYLSERFKDFKDPTSRDRLKRCAGIPRYALKHDLSQANFVVGDDEQDLPAVRMDYPVATLVRCGGQLFLAVGEVNDLLRDAVHVGQILTSHLGEPSVQVSFQLLILAPANDTDDPTLKNDWKWSFQRGVSHSVPGRLVEAINPDISTKESGKPSYLFDTASLQAIGTLLLERLSREDNHHIPSLLVTASFPYRQVNGKACFLCEDANRELDLLSMKQCPGCQTNLPETPQKVLEHIGAHILNDNSLDTTTQPCGLCLRPSPICVFYLTKGKGSKSKPKINYNMSKCANLISFKYGVAASSSASNPCTNVPMTCRFCPEGSAAIWRYNMKDHLKDQHQHVSLAESTDMWKISDTERMQMKQVWQDRKKVKKSRMSKKKKTPLEISEEHSSRVSLLNVPGSPPQDDTNLDAERSPEAVSDADESSENDDEGTAMPEPDDSELNADCMPAGASVFETADIADDTHERPATSQISQPSANPSLQIQEDVEVDIPAQVNRDNGEEDRPRRIRKRKYVADHKCVCGAVAAPDELEVIKCKMEGCETGYYHLSCVKLDYVVRNWVCEACMGTSGREKKRRR